MKEAFVYALAALGAVSIARWILTRLLKIALDRSGMTRRIRRRVWRHAFEMLQSPGWQESLIREAERQADDLATALGIERQPRRSSLQSGS